MPTFGGSSDSRLLSNTFVLLGIAALGLSLSGNFLYGQHSALTEDGQWWQGARAIMIDSSLAVLALFVGKLVSDRKYISASIFGIVAVMFGLASAYSLISFGLSEQVNKTKTVAVNSERSEAVGRINFDSKTEAYQGYMALLDQNVLAAKNQKDRETALDARRRAVAEAPQMSIPEITSAMTDAGAETAAAYAKRANISLKVEDFQVAQNIFTTILIVIGKALFFGLAGYTRPKPSVVAMAVSMADTAVPPQKALRGMRGTQAERAHARKDADRIAARFLAEATYPLQGNAIKATEFHQHFLKWAERSKETPLGVNHFGRAMTRIKAEKVQTANNFIYVNLGLKGASEKSGAGAREPRTHLNGENVRRLPLATNRLVA